MTITENPILLAITIYLVIVNIVAFVMYGIDKYKAQHDQWRISEKALMISAAVGGSVGALLGMRFFHHKTKHKLFTIGVPLILCVHLVVFYFLFKGILN